MYVSLSAAVIMLVHSKGNEWLSGTGNSLTCGGLREALRVGFGTLV